MIFVSCFPPLTALAVGIRATVSRHATHAYRARETNKERQKPFPFATGRGRCAGPRGTRCMATFYHKPPRKVKAKFSRIMRANAYTRKCPYKQRQKQKITFGEKISVFSLDKSSLCSIGKCHLPVVCASVAFFSHFSVFLSLFTQQASFVLVW